MHGADVRVRGADVRVRGADVRVHDADLRAQRGFSVIADFRWALVYSNRNDLIQWYKR